MTTFDTATNPEPGLLDEHRVALAFGRAAPDYEQVALVQREVAQRLDERLDDLPPQTPRRVLDLGAGTGLLTRHLAARYPHAEIYGLDLAPSMLQSARQQAPRWFSKQHYCAADARSLPLPDASIDLLMSNLMLQWCNDYRPVFAEFARVLKPGGRLLFSTLGPDTLWELRESWAAVDSHNHVNRFADLHAVGDALFAAGLVSPVLDVDRLTQTFPDGMTLMQHLKRLGAHNVTAGRPRGLTGRGSLQKMLAHYEQYRQADRLPASYEVIYAYAQGRTSPLTVGQAADTTHIGLETLRQHLKQRK